LGQLCDQLLSQAAVLASRAWLRVLSFHRDRYRLDGQGASYLRELYDDTFFVYLRLTAR